MSTENAKLHQEIESLVNEKQCLEDILKTCLLEREMGKLRTTKEQDEDADDDHEGHRDDFIGAAGNKAEGGLAYVLPQR